MLLFSCPLHGPFAVSLCRCARGLDRLSLRPINRQANVAWLVADGAPEAQVTIEIYRRYRVKEVGAVNLSHLLAKTNRKTRILGRRLTLREGHMHIVASIQSTKLRCLLRHGQPVEKRPVQRSIKKALAMALVSRSFYIISAKQHRLPAFPLLLPSTFTSSPELVFEFIEYYQGTHSQSLTCHRDSQSPGFSSS